MARPKPNLTEEQLKARSAMWIQKWRINNPEKQKLARKRAYNNRKIRAIEMVGKAECVYCGCDELSFLEFNHINGGGCQEFKNSKYASMMDRILTNKRTVDGLEIVCRVCNALDFLKRKNKEASKRFIVRYEKQTGQKAKKISK